MRNATSNLPVKFVSSLHICGTPTASKWWHLRDHIRSKGLASLAGLRIHANTLGCSRSQLVILCLHKVCASNLEVPFCNLAWTGFGFAISPPCPLFCDTISVVYDAKFGATDACQRKLGKGIPRKVHGRQNLRFGSWRKFEIGKSRVLVAINLAFLQATLPFVLVESRALA